MSSITFQSVTKKYDDGSVPLDNLDLHIDDGECVVIVGPSGCGKSTTLNIVAGLESITSGDLFIGNKRVNDIPARERDVAMVFQSYALYPHLTVRENIAFPLRMAKKDKAYITAQVDAVATRLDLFQLLDKKPVQLSGGQRQRVAMGRAIIRRPLAFLMDEPLSNLDAQLRGKVRAEIAIMRRELSTTTLYVTHDQTEAMTLGDRIVVMAKGKIQQVGTPQEIYDHPATMFVASFFGQPGMNFLLTKISEETLTTPFGNIERRKINGSINKKIDKLSSVMLGFRPEGAFIHEESKKMHLTDQTLLQGVLTYSEYLGSDIFFTMTAKKAKLDTTRKSSRELQTGVSINNTECIVRSRTVAADIRLGENVHFYIDPQHIHYFDPVTGRSLGYKYE